MTTAAQRKQRSEKSVVIVERVVRAQLRAMGGWRFDLGVRRDGGQMVLREGHDVFAARDAVKWLRHVCGQGCGKVAPSRKRQGRSRVIWPAGVHSLSLLDDLTAETIERMKAEGFEPAAVVETSLNNFQVWLNHGEILAAAISMAAAKAPVERFGGDPSSADWRHFGRLAGFTNPKPERQPASGLRHRADLAWAKQAAGRGLTLDKIRNELFNGRDLSKKGNRKRQLEYVARTAEKALRSL